MGEPSEKVDKIYDAILSFREEVKRDMKEMRESVEEKIDGVKVNITNMELKLENQDKRIGLIEREKRKRNVIVYGIEEQVDEKWSDLKVKVVGFLNNKLNIITNMNEIDDFFRMGKKCPNKSRPIMLKLTTYWKKLEIIRSTGRLKGTKIFLDHDLSIEEINEKKKLIPTMLNFRKSGQHAVMRGSQLYVNGSLYKNVNTLVKDFSSGNSKDMEMEVETIPTSSFKRAIAEGDTSQKNPNVAEHVLKKQKTHQRSLSQGSQGTILRASSLGQLTLEKVGLAIKTNPAVGSNTSGSEGETNNSAAGGQVSNIKQK